MYKKQPLEKNDIKSKVIGNMRDVFQVKDCICYEI